MAMVAVVSKQSLLNALESRARTLPLPGYSCVITGNAGITGRGFLKRRSCTVPRKASLTLQIPMYNASSSKNRHMWKVRCSMPESMPEVQSHNQNFLSTVTTVIKNVSRAVAAMLFFAIITMAAVPSLLSWQKGLNAAVWVANKSIPGTLSVQKVSLGWTKPVHIEGVSLEDEEGEAVLLIQKILTKASLLSIIMGRSGLGDCTITMPRINLLEEKSTGLPRLALALEPAQKLLGSKKQPPKKKQASEPTAIVKLAGNVKAVNGDLQVKDGELLLPADAAATLGNKVYVDVLLGQHALNENAELQQSGHSRFLPLHGTMWSECAQVQATGFINLAVQKLELIKPIKMEMDLTPDVGRLYLARVNPLLGSIVGPAVVEDDLPDIILQISPRDMKFPADQYRLHFEPMKVVLARGTLVDGILSLLSKEDIAKGKRQIKMETSVIEANADMDGVLTCSRIDVLIGGKVHVATWGQVDWIDEKVKMTLAVPGSTLKDLLGLDKLPENYNLQIPVRGTFDRPQIDLKAAGFGIAQLTLHQQAGPFAKSLLGALDAPPDAPVPEPIDVLPWASK